MGSCVVEEHLEEQIFGCKESLDGSKGDLSRKAVVVIVVDEGKVIDTIPRVAIARTTWVNV
jgi:hypothetical protein